MLNAPEARATPTEQRKAAPAIRHIALAGIALSLSASMAAATEDLDAFLCSPDQMAGFRLDADSDWIPVDSAPGDRLLIDELEETRTIDDAPVTYTVTIEDQIQILMYCQNVAGYLICGRLGQSLILDLFTFDYARQSMRGMTVGGEVPLFLEVGHCTRR